MKTPSNTRRPSRNLEWIMQESWRSVKSGSIASKSQILCVLVRLLVCRWRRISSNERQKRPRIVKCWGGRSAPGNGGRLTLLGHQSQRHRPQVAKRGGRFARIVQNEVISFPCFFSPSGRVNSFFQGFLAISLKAVTPVLPVVATSNDVITLMILLPVTTWMWRAELQSQE